MENNITQIEWKEDFAVGNDSIDHQHKSLIEQINQLYQMLAKSTDSLSIENMLDDLQADISAHFAFEELTMNEAKFEEYEAHKRDHETLLDQINDLIFHFSEDPEAGRQLLKEQLSDWFARHFVTFDARLHDRLAV